MYGDEARLGRLLRRDGDCDCLPNVTIVSGNRRAHRNKMDGQVERTRTGSNGFLRIGDDKGVKYLNAWTERRTCHTKRGKPGTKDLLWLLPENQIRGFQVR